MRKQPYSECLTPYIPHMEPVDSRQALWTSLSSLMKKHWGGENLTKLGREAAKSSPAQAVRMKSLTNSTGIEVIDRLAAFFGVEAWQLLVPGFDAENPPKLAADKTSLEVFSPELRNQIATLDKHAVRKLENVMRTHLDMDTLARNSSFTDGTSAKTEAKQMSYGLTSDGEQDQSLPRRQA